MSFKRIALVIQYIGTNFYGWQVQPNRRTVQGELESALGHFLGDHVSICCSGRTDSGVHALAQVAHFDTSSKIPPRNWTKVLNSMLPADVRVVRSTEVELSWHARFSSLWRRYRYLVCTGESCGILSNPYCWHRRGQILNVELVNEALAMLLGRHSFEAFHRAGSHRLDSWVNVQDVCCFSRSDFVIFEVQADGFLYGMMRLLVSLLVDVGCGRRSLSDFSNIVVCQRRDLVKHSAPAKGLFLQGIGYCVSL